MLKTGHVFLCIWIINHNYFIFTRLVWTADILYISNWHSAIIFYDQVEIKWTNTKLSASKQLERQIVKHYNSTGEWQTVSTFVFVEGSILTQVVSCLFVSSGWRISHVSSYYNRHGQVIYHNMLTVLLPVRLSAEISVSISLLCHEDVGNDIFDQKWTVKQCKFLYLKWVNLYENGTHYENMVPVFLFWVTYSQLLIGDFKVFCIDKGLTSEGQKEVIKFWAI